MTTYIFHSKLPNLIVKKYSYIHKKMMPIARFDENKEFRTDNHKLYLILKNKYPCEIESKDGYDKMTQNELRTLGSQRGFNTYQKPKKWIIEKLYELDAKEKLKEEMIKNAVPLEKPTS